jgi:hypothetical protein
MEPGTGTKHDNDKPKWDLLPLKLVNETVEVLTYGAKKYLPNNWKVVENGIDRYYAACLRHLTAWRMGEANDPESGYSHLAHAMCNLIFIAELEQ